MQELLRKAYDHKGTSFVEIYTNCRIFNDGAFDLFSNVESREEHTVFLEHGKPLLFGKNKSKGIILDGFSPRAVDLTTAGHSIDDVLIHNEQDSTLAFILANMTYHESLPRPMGVFQNISKTPYEVRVQQQIEDEIKVKGEGNLEELLRGTNSWEIK